MSSSYEALHLLTGAVSKAMPVARAMTISTLIPRAMPTNHRYVQTSKDWKQECRLAGSRVSVEGIVCVRKMARQEMLERPSVCCYIMQASSFIERAYLLDQLGRSWAVPLARLGRILAQVALECGIT